MSIIPLSIVIFLIACFFSMIGMGGGIFYVPVLLFFGLPIHNASAMSLALIFASSLSALIVFHKQDLVDWKLAAVIDPPTDIMAFLGGYLSGFVPGIYLKLILFGVLITSGYVMMRNFQVRHCSVKEGRWWIWRREFNGQVYQVNLLYTIPITAGIGLLAGMLGIAGGVVKLPLMVVLCGVPMGIAIATSTVMVALTVAFGMIGHLAAGHLDVFQALPLMLVCFIGGQIGSRISVRADKAILKKIIAIALFIVAFKILFDALS